MVARPRYLWQTGTSTGNEHRRGATSRIRSPDLTSQPPRSIDTGEAITDHPSAAEVYRNVESEVWEAIGTNLC